MIWSDSLFRPGRIQGFLHIVTTIFNNFCDTNPAGLMLGYVCCIFIVFFFDVVISNSRICAATYRYFLYV